MPYSISVIAVDDEPLSLAQITKYIAKVPFLELVGSFTNASDAGKFLSANSVDAMFLDINMPDLSGLDFVRSLKNPPLVVFTTAYSEYAVEGFRVNAVDYLLKPFSVSELLVASEKLKSRLELMRAANSSSEGSVRQDSSVFFKSGYKIVKVNASDIIYVESMSEYLKIYEVGEEMPKVVLSSFQKLLEKLPSDIFVRVHRSYVVNLSKVREISGGTLKMEDGRVIPIGDSYRSSLSGVLK